jgi:hypothetical protein
MAEQGNQTALVPVEGEYVMQIKEFQSNGNKLEVKVAAPLVADFRQWSLMQQVAMLKNGPWSKSPINEIIFGIAYATSLGLDVMRGDVFPTGEGRLGIANKAKIKMALRTGQIEGIETNIVDTGKAIDLAGCVQKTDLECTVTVHVKGWVKPIVRKAKLSRWYKAKNPNWAGNPEHMLELNTVAHALEYVNPTATEDDEAPPLLDKTEPVVAALNKAKEEVQTETKQEKA